MAKSKVVWSRTAKKKLYAILEASIRRNKNKDQSYDFFKIFARAIKKIQKCPESGIMTSAANILAFVTESFIIFFEISEGKIIIHTISEKAEN